MMGSGAGKPVPAYKADAAGQVVVINQALLDLLGCPHAELSERAGHPDAFTDPHLHQHLLDQARQADSVRSFEHELIHFSGRSLWVRHLVLAVRAEDGEVVGFEGLVMDVTARKRATERLRYSKERYRSLDSRDRPSKSP